MSRTITASILADATVNVPDHITTPREIREYIANNPSDVELEVEADGVGELWSADSGELIAGESDE